MLTKSPTTAKCMFCRVALDADDVDYLICRHCEWLLPYPEDAEVERELEAERKWERKEAARQRAEDRRVAAREARHKRKIEPLRPGVAIAAIAPPILRKRAAG